MNLRKSSFIAAIGAWCILILAAPVVKDRVPSVGLFLYLFFSPICHQLPERSFFLFGGQLPVCARCTGIYFGALVGSFFVRQKSPSPWFLVVAMIPLALDGVTQLFFRESTNVIRLATGLIAGFAAVFYLYAGLCSDEPERKIYSEKSVI